METVMHTIDQNSLLVNLHFGIDFVQPPRFLNTDHSEIVKLDNFPSFLLNIIQASKRSMHLQQGNAFHHYSVDIHICNGYLLHFISTCRFKIYRKTSYSDDHVRVVNF